ncbi:hypothetical protein ACIQUL_34070 [Streptomyces sp. NPDC090303]|uniref:hypothetical protein n=1 Tax=Streptomyces sp. NPDC090303 TaxID=3365960 RepID=UPI00380D5AFB
MLIAMGTGVKLVQDDWNGIEVQLHHEEEVPNYALSRLSSTEISMVYGAIPECANFMICGDSYIPDQITLCGSPDAPGCTEGDHTCDGLLGILRDYQVAIVSCRAENELVEWSGHHGFLEKISYSIPMTDEQLESAYQVLIGERESGSTELFSPQGRFTSIFEALPQEKQIALMEYGMVREWCLVRSAWEVSDGFRSSTKLTNYKQALMRDDPAVYEELTSSQIYKEALRRLARDAFETASRTAADGEIRTKGKKAAPEIDETGGRSGRTVSNSVRARIARRNAAAFDRLAQESEGGGKIYLEFAVYHPEGESPVLRFEAPDMPMVDFDHTYAGKVSILAKGTRNPLVALRRRANNEHVRGDAVIESSHASFNLEEAVKLLNPAVTRKIFTRRTS